MVSALLRRLFQGAAPAIPAEAWSATVHRLPWVAALDAPRAARLARLAATFLHRKTITPVGDLQLADDDRIALAALCCLPLLEFGQAGLRG